uniref:Myoglobin n=1 Tax=Ascaris suum TaxID=6253 RepID=GLB2_ASCSU|nr:RecName: Full=Myoglobin; AltName: Full=Globin, body wall isoform [Ascaris suum]AAA64695.1 myoglobin [Ascaris suum]
MATACVKSLESVQCGTCEKTIANGTEFYALLFDKHPDLRHYFKGNENLTGADVKKSDHFKKQGQRLLLACHVLAHLENDPASFKAYAREIVDPHLRMSVHLEPKLWSEFWPIWLDYLSTKESVDDATKNAWLALGKKFSDECLDHLKNLGQPH